LPGLVHVGAAPRLRLIELPDRPHRTVFTAVRASQGRHPALAAVREALAAEAARLPFD
jgi:hypothetical protein